jgi:hypothetical protein
MAKPPSLSLFKMLLLSPTGEISLTKQKAQFNLQLD